MAEGYPKGDFTPGLTGECDPEIRTNTEGFAAEWRIMSKEAFDAQQAELARLRAEVGRLELEREEAVSIALGWWLGWRAKSGLPPIDPREAREDIRRTAQNKASHLAKLAAAGLDAGDASAPPAP